MRIVLIGASPLSIAAARLMLAHGHEVVLIEQDESVIEELSEGLDCGFLAGDGSKPSVLREVSPEHTHYLFCLSDSDQENIIAAVVGRKLGFERIVVHIRDPDYGPICEELDIDEVINPDQEVGRALADIVEGEQSTDYRGLLHEGVRFFSFVATEGEAGPLGALQLPEGARVIAVSRDDKSRLADPETEVKEGDEILLIADQAQIKTLRERFHPPKN